MKTPSGLARKIELAAACFVVVANSQFCFSPSGSYELMK